VLDAGRQRLINSVEIQAGVTALNEAFLSLFDFCIRCDSNFRCTNRAQAGESEQSFLDFR
jgi:hypothetical protein